MKRIITGCLLLNFAMAAQAECKISTMANEVLPCAKLTGVKQHN